MKYLVLLALLFVGCSATEITTKETELKIQEQLIRNYALPFKSKNVIYLGNSWVTFDLEINGKTRNYLLQYSPPHVVELSD